MAAVLSPHAPLRYMMALGPGIEQMRQALTTQFFPKHFPAWRMDQPEPLSTDTLLDAADAAPNPWDVVLVTDRLAGTLTLANVLATIKLRWPGCHIVVLLRGITPATQALAANLATYQIYNLCWDRISPDVLITLLTEPAPWERLLPILPTTPQEPMLRQDFPKTPPASERSHLVPPPTKQEPVAPRTHATIAVVAGSSGIGKSGWLANMAVAGSAWHSVILDADPWRPGILPYFYDPALMDAPVHHWQTLLAALGDGDPKALDRLTWTMPTWTETQRSLIRQYVHEARAVRPGVQWVPGVSLHYPTPVPYVPHLLDEMVTATYALGQITWIDTATIPDTGYLRDSCRLADHIVVIVTPQYPVVTHTLQLLDTLTQWGVPSAKITWALMRQGRGGFSTRDLQRIQLAQWPCLGEWPDDPTTWEGALQRHRPLAETHPDLWQRALTTLVGPLPAPTPPTREHRRWARRTKT